MKAVISIDSFKGSLSSMEAGNACARGIKAVYPDAVTVVKPLADGGEGTVDALVEGLKGEKRTIEVTGPLEKKISATYGIVKEQALAIIEMSAAAGITLVPTELRNPFNTTTFGVGELIRDAIQQGCKRFIVGIGGSATNDGGVGMLQALGFKMLDSNNQDIPLGAKGLKVLDHIEKSPLLEELQACEFKVACDVNNPLYGENGSSAVFGPQKGATPEMVKELDELLKRYAEITKEVFKEADPLFPGVGAAGGLGFAFYSFLKGDLQSGIDIVLDAVKLDEELVDCDLVITGEGRLDFQTAMGKAPVGVALRGKKYQKPVFAFAGSVTKEAKKVNEKGIDAFFPILRSITTLEEAMKEEVAAENMQETVEQVMRVFNL